MHVNDHSTRRAREAIRHSRVCACVCACLLGQRRRHDLLQQPLHGFRGLGPITQPLLHPLSVNVGLLGQRVVPAELLKGQPFPPPPRVDRHEPVERPLLSPEALEPQLRHKNKANDAYVRRNERVGARQHDEGANVGETAKQASDDPSARSPVGRVGMGQGCLLAMQRMIVP